MAGIAGQDFSANLQEIRKVEGGIWLAVETILDMSLLSLSFKLQFALKVR